MEILTMTILSQPGTRLSTSIDKLRTIEAELSATLIERESVIHGAILALVARQHVMPLGAPGTGKSYMVRAVAQRISSANRFELLLTKFTTPEELFGPLSIVEASDRRWCGALGLLRASALMMGRDHVNADDLEILTDVLWRRMEDRPVVAKAVARAGNPVRARVVELVDESVAIHADTLRQLGGDDPDGIQRAAMTANSRLKGILTELGRLRDNNPGADAARIDGAIDRVRELNGEVVRRGFAL